MNQKVNDNLVQSTNDASIVSKCSTVLAGYIKDGYINFFVDKKKRRAPLLHLGYYTRMAIIEKMVNKFLCFGGRHKKQIISCGAGFDTLYWRLCESEANQLWSLVEVDFPDLITRKLAAIKVISRHSYPAESMMVDNGSVKVSKNYVLIGCDLSCLTELDNVLCQFVDYKAPTLFISECAVTYMHRKDSDALFSWISNKFKNAAVLNYEQINSEDGFGSVMMRHFETIGSPLRSVSTYPTLEKHISRFSSLGFSSSWAIDEWALFRKLLTSKEIDAAFEKEQFDELEEFHSKCTHYVTAFAGSGCLKSWWLPLSNENSFKFNDNAFNILSHKIIMGPPQLYGQATCQNGSTVYISGGLNVSGKSSTTYVMTTEGDCVPESVEKGDLVYDAVHGSVVFLPGRKDESYILFYGGRTSPQKIWCNGSIKVFSTEKTLIPLKDESTEEPTPRYRSPLILFRSDENTATLFMFGGRTSDLSIKLSDTWCLTINYNALHSKWTELKALSHPSPRMSHGLVACDNDIFLSCGLDSLCYNALDDIWKWNGNCTWQQLAIVGRIFPRYGHTSHIIDNVLYLIGGVSTLPEAIPLVMALSLSSMSVQYFNQEMPSPRDFLPFNHTSVVINNKSILLIGGGGKCFSFGTQLNTHAVSLF